MGQAVGFIELDIDYFKQLNDRYGHSAGDAVLVVVAEVLLTELTADAGLVARTGGEEFVVVVPVDSGRDLALLHSLVDVWSLNTPISQSASARGAPVLRSADWLRRPTHAGDR